MKGLLLRLSALDADAATAVRVIAHFEALLGGALDPVTLTRSTAGLAGCAAGLELPDGRAARFAPDGAALAGAPAHVSGRVDLEPAGRVWLERPGAPGPFDELVLEWMAIAARVLAGRPRPTRTPRAADPALVELVLSGREAVEDRARALRLLGLEPGTPLRVIAVAADAAAGPGTDTGASRSADAGVEAVALLGRGALRGTVRVARVGSLGAVLVQRRDGASGGPGASGGQAVPGGQTASGSRPGGTASPAVELRAAMRERVRERSAARRPAPGTRVGIGSEADPLDAHASWAQARSALRFAVAGAPEEAVADHDELGPLVLLADIPVERLRAQADVRRLGELGEPAHGERGGPTTGQARPGGELLAALAAFCRTGSLRQAAAELHLHHSSVAARLSHVEKELGWRLRDPQDRFRAQLALYALRLAGNGDG
ncbi:helix-turn-helix domain-containing protein [Streptomyces radiopugnans]|uniref:PucR C-terminal helix-turn-helix domain-containing protein n=1 Tax=Streptomyces radiopugnans TaxID=403935 RepID=A0A1H8ZNW0_9ACTN|nr:helix-turn-helix domain-containing protein [Streptomyces radiopugnans]SEP65961.1 PucR C-terminal helix-turn-helix domain-containing protein [Streptomyces radiopugnans]